MVFVRVEGFQETNPNRQLNFELSGKLPL